MLITFKDFFPDKKKATMTVAFFIKELPKGYYRLLFFAGCIAF
jgi:hypothetical protein